MTDGAVFQGRKRNLSQHKQIRKALGLNAQNYSKVSEDSSLQLFNSCSFLNDMPLAFCIIELVFDAEGHGVDFVFRYCNDEMAVVEGIPVSEMLNRSFYEVFENGDKKWLVTYADVALNGNPLVFDTFDKAVATNPGATPLLHSDRGYQYTSKAFRRRILAAGMTQSMSRVARCIDNGPMEGFWGLMKREMYYGKKYKTKEELMLAIEKYIDYYTNKRVQRNLEVLTPLEFHEQKLENVA